MAITNFISTVWSENLLKQLDSQYIGVLNCNREFEGEIKDKGCKVNICGVGNINVYDYEKGADMDSPEDLSDYMRTLEINQAKYFNFQIDDVDKAQCNPRLMDEAMKKAAEALANEADRYVYSLSEETDIELEVDEATPENIINTIFRLKTDMLKNNVTNANDIIIEVSPDVAEKIMKAKIDLGTDNYDVLEAGLLGKVAGCKIYVSNNIYLTDTGYQRCIMRTKRAVAFAEQISEVEAYRPEKRFADAVKGLHLYGAKIVYPEEYMVFSVKAN